MAQVYLRVFRNPAQTLVAVCDPSLIGRTFREGKIKLEIKEEFYRGSLTSVEEAMKALKAASIGNLVGEMSVDAAVNRGLVDPSAIIRVSGVPHVQIVKL